jgi:hypothetical protein
VTTPAAITVVVLKVRPHSSVIDGAEDAKHHARQWAIQIRMSFGGVSRTWWEWLEADAPPTLDEATRIVARGLVAERHDTSIERFDPSSRDRRRRERA